MSTATASEKSTSGDYGHGRVAKIQDVDVAAVFDSDKPLQPEIAANLRSVLTTFMNSKDPILSRRKIDYYLMPLMCRELYKRINLDECLSYICHCATVMYLYVWDGFFLLES